MSMRIILFSVFFAIALSSCEDDKEGAVGDDTVTVRIDARVLEAPFELGTVYTEGNGYRYRLETFRTYISMLELVDANGNATLLKDFYVGSMDETHSFRARVKEGDYSLIRFYLGVPADYNKNVDPTTYPNSHPLSVQGSQGMFWHWNTGYIFTKFDGKADLEGIESNPLLDPFAFHCGDDPLLRIVSLPIAQGFIEGETSRVFQIHCQVDKLLQGDAENIDIAVDYLTHTQGNFLLARRFMDNFGAAFELEE